MIVASCHCGTVSLVIPAAPDTVTVCNCSICRRYGAVWAYFDVAEVEFLPAHVATEAYAWDDRSLAFHRCALCGCVTHWWPINREGGQMGVNARLLPPEVMMQARVRHLDGAVTEAYLD